MLGAFSIPGPSFSHVSQPCVEGCISGSLPSSSVSRVAVEGRSKEPAGIVGESRLLLDWAALAVVLSGNEWHQGRELYIATWTRQGWLVLHQSSTPESHASSSSTVMRSSIGVGTEDVGHSPGCSAAHSTASRNSPWSMSSAIL